MNEWVALLVGAALTLLGSLIGQWFSGRQASRQANVEREHNRSVWLRGVRFDIHNEFTQTYQRNIERIGMRWEAPEHAGAPLDPGEVFNSMIDLRTRIELWATEPVFNVANQALYVLDRYGQDPVHAGAVIEAFEEYKRQVRTESGEVAAAPIG